MIEIGKGMISLVVSGRFDQKRLPIGSTSDWCVVWLIEFRLKVPVDNISIISELLYPGENNGID